jgi:hypothetical protein
MTRTKEWFKEWDYNHRKHLLRKMLLKLDKIKEEYRRAYTLTKES